MCRERQVYAVECGAACNAPRREARGRGKVQFRRLVVRRRAGRDREIGWVRPNREGQVRSRGRDVRSHDLAPLRTDRLCARWVGGVPAQLLRMLIDLEDSGKMVFGPEGTQLAGSQRAPVIRTCSRWPVRTAGPGTPACTTPANCSPPSPSTLGSRACFALPSSSSARTAFRVHPFVVKLTFARILTF